MSELLRSVSWLNEYVAARLSEDTVLSNLSIVGEISGGRRYPSGHYYFTLKDDRAQVSCVFFSIARARLAFEPKDGMKVVCRARAALYQKDGRFQLIVQHLEEEGVGQLYRRFLETKSRLEKEGLFDPAKKRPIPYWPKRIGVITSSAGAVLSDMIVVLRKQAPSFDLLLYPTAVQGENAPGEIVQAIEQANRERKVDVLIVGRGGGSFEDLYAYNEEIVVRAIRDSKIPVISAVGHETDVTLADFAADLRMPTPTAAAGAVMPQRKELSTALERVKNRLTLSLQRLVEQRRRELSSWQTRIALRHPARVLETKRQTLDLLRDQLLRSLRRKKEDDERSLHLLKQTIERQIREALHRASVTLAGTKERLALLHPAAALKRGYAFVTTSDGRIIQSTTETNVGADLIIRLTDGSLAVTVDDIKKETEDESDG